MANKHKVYDKLAAHDKHRPTHATILESLSAPPLCGTAPASCPATRAPSPEGKTARQQAADF